MRIFGLAFPLDVLFRLCFHESDKLERRFLSACGQILGSSTSRLSVAAEGPSILSLSCALFEVHALLLYVSFQLLFSITTQFTLALDFLEELQNLRPDGVMTTQECH
jgi:hypothetical protein